MLLDGCRNVRELALRLLPRTKMNPRTSDIPLQLMIQDQFDEDIDMSSAHSFPHFFIVSQSHSLHSFTSSSRYEKVYSPERKESSYIHICRLVVDMHVYLWTRNRHSSMRDQVMFTCCLVNGRGEFGE